MIDMPEIVDLPERLTAIIALVTPSATIRQTMGPGIQEVYAALAAQGINAAGPWFTHHNRAPTDTFDFEISVPTEGQITPSGRVTPAVWPAMRVVRTTYRGGYEALGNGWGAFLKWIEAQGLQTTDDLWETYAVGPESGPDSSQYQTILHKPLKA